MTVLRRAVWVVLMVALVPIGADAETVGIGNIIDGFDQTTASFEFYNHLLAEQRAGRLPRTITYKLIDHPSDAPIAVTGKLTTSYTQRFDVPWDYWVFNMLTMDLYMFYFFSARGFHVTDYKQACDLSLWRQGQKVQQLQIDHAHLPPSMKASTLDGSLRTPNRDLIRGRLMAPVWDAANREILRIVSQ